MPICLKPDRGKRDKGKPDVKLGEVKATYVRQVLRELQETTQRLREIETTLGPARELLDIKADGASEVTDEADYLILIRRVEHNCARNTNPPRMEASDLYERGVTNTAMIPSASAAATVAPTSSFRRQTLASAACRTSPKPTSRQEGSI